MSDETREIKMDDTDKARAYLINELGVLFADYIKDELAGDFAYSMAQNHKAKCAPDQSAEVAKLKKELNKAGRLFAALRNERDDARASTANMKSLFDETHQQLNDALAEGARLKEKIDRLECELEISVNE